MGVGVDSRLHAIGTLVNPDTPLLLKKMEWDALLKSGGLQTVSDWACGDHGAEEAVDLELQATRRGISVTEKHYRCPRAGKGNLIRSVDR